MQEYTYDELRQMQEKALQRVRNMQQRARQYVEADNRAAEQKPAQNNAGRQSAQNAGARTSPAQSTGTPHKTSPGRIKMPLNLPENRDLTYPSFKEYFDPETQKAKAQTEQKTKANLLDDVLREPDEAMLFSLLLLLKSEGTDEALLMALLYIMS